MRKRHFINQRTGTFNCKCGCGQTFVAAYKTRPPQYANRIHHLRSLAARKAESRRNKPRPAKPAKRDSGAVSVSLGRREVAPGFLDLYYEIDWKRVNRRIDRYLSPLGALYLAWDAR